YPWTSVDELGCSDSPPKLGGVARRAGVVPNGTSPLASLASPPNLGGDLSARGPTTVDHQARAGDERSGWRGKEQDGSCDFLNPPEPPEGNPTHHPISKFGVRQKRSSHRRFEKSGSDRVHSNVGRREF